MRGIQRFGTALTCERATQSLPAHGTRSQQHEFLALVGTAHIEAISDDVAATKGEQTALRDRSFFESFQVDQAQGEAGREQYGRINPANQGEFGCAIVKGNLRLRE